MPSGTSIWAPTAGSGPGETAASSGRLWKKNPAARWSGGGRPESGIIFWSGITAGTGASPRDETEAETAAREILEETGLTADIHTAFRQQVTYSPKPGTVKDVIFFTAVPTGGREHPQESEISQLGWFSFPEAARRVTYASDEEVLLAAEAYLNQN